MATKLELLPLNQETKALLRKVACDLKPIRGDIIQNWILLYKKSSLGTAGVSDEDVDKFIERLVTLFIDEVEAGHFDAFFACVNEAGKEMVALGLPYENLILAVHLYESVTLPYLVSSMGTSEELFNALDALDHLYHNTLALLASSYFSGIIDETEKKNRELSALYTVAAFLSQTYDIQSVLEGSLDKVMQLMSLSYGEVFEFKEDEDVLFLRARRGSSPSFIKEVPTFRLGEGIPGLVVKQGRPLVVNDIWSDGRFVRTDGLKKELMSAIGVPLLAGGKAVGAMVFFSTESPPVSKEDLAVLISFGNQIGIGLANARLYQMLLKRTEELEDLNRKREQFTSVVSHEFRGPLTIIGGYAQMMLSILGKGTPDGKKLETIYSQSKQLTRLVDDLQDVTKIQTGNFDLELAPENFVEVVQDVAAAQQSTTEQHKIIFEPVMESLVFDFDQGRITQVVSNLLSNAIKFSPEGGEIRIEIDQREGSAIVSVTDQGVGIDPEYMSRLFEPFARLPRPPGVKGSGLGLFITKGIIEAHGGRIWAKSEPGKGSTFTFELPL